MQKSNPTTFPNLENKYPISGGSSVPRVYITIATFPLSSVERQYLHFDLLEYYCSYNAFGVNISPLKLVGSHNNTIPPRTVICARVCVHKQTPVRIVGYINAMLLISCRFVLWDFADWSIFRGSKRGCRFFAFRSPVKWRADRWTENVGEWYGETALFFRDGRFNFKGFISAIGWNYGSEAIRAFDVYFSDVNIVWDESAGKWIGTMGSKLNFALIWTVCFKQIGNWRFCAFDIIYSSATFPKILNKMKGSAVNCDECQNCFFL